jgi:SAM-dependent methyltransferase
LESETRDTFNRIAPGWYSFRHWTIFRKELEAVAQRWQDGRLLNLGCAHGPDFLPFRENFELHGVDFSGEMIKLARRYADKFGFDADLAVADVGQLPYADQTFDWAISVATYHHVKGKDERETAFRELSRVLKPGGEAFITVWNRWQTRFWFHGKEVSVPWRRREETFYRYYYLYSYAEIKRLVRRSGFEVLDCFPESSYRYPLKWFSRNICLLLKKVD